MAFTERNVSKEPEARDELIKLGFQAVPVTVIDGQKISGFQPSELEQALGLS